MKKGLFIVLDGNDGSGKATQSRMLVERLSREGIHSQKTDFPGYERNFFGGLLGECLAGHHGDFVNLDPKIASAIYALDRLESSEGIRAAIENGQVVIADRFASSNQIHQGGKIADEDKRRDFIQWLDRMEHEVLHIPRPDLVLYLRVPTSMSLELLSKKRAAKNQTLQDGQRDMVEEDRAYLENSHHTANWLLDSQPNWRLIECLEDGAMRSPEAIHEDVWTSVLSALPPA